MQLCRGRTSYTSSAYNSMDGASFVSVDSSSSKGYTKTQTCSPLIKQEC